MDFFAEMAPKFLGKFSIIKTIFLSRLMFGNYFKISESKIVCILIRLYCICIIAFINYFYIKDYARNGYRLDYSKPYVYVHSEYISNIVSSFIFRENYIFEYYASIKIGDSLMGFKKISIVPKSFYFIIVLFALNRFSLTMVMLLYATSDKIFFACRCLTIISLDLNNMVFIAIFSLLHSRVKLLRKNFEGFFTPVTVRGCNEVTFNKKIKKCLYYYNYLMDNIFKVQEYFQYTVNVYNVFYNKINIIKYVDKMNFIKSFQLAFGLVIRLPRLIAQAYNLSKTIFHQASIAYY